MKPIRILFRSISSAFKSVIRNLSLSVASISCIIITLILVAFAVLLSANINNFTSDIEDDLTMVVFVKKETTDEEIEDLKKNIDAVPNIRDVVYKSKVQIKDEMSKEDETYNRIMSEWKEDENPLKPAFIISVDKIEVMGETANTIMNLEHVDIVKYGKNMVESLVDIFDIVKKVTYVAVIALVFVTAFLISNTIKITIYSRKNEIDIMRLVGTSNMVIKLPFLFEGLFLGIIGSILPVIFTIYGYIFLYDKMGGVMFTKIISLINPYDFVFKVSAVLVVIGAVVGMYGSYKAVRRYLKI